jgi:hypothetical protein
MRKLRVEPCRGECRTCGCAMKRGGLCRKCRNAENREKFRESNPNDKPPDVLKVFLDVLDMPDVELAHYIEGLRASHDPHTGAICIDALEAKMLAAKTGMLVRVTGTGWRRKIMLVKPKEKK